MVEHTSESDALFSGRSTDRATALLAVGDLAVVALVLLVGELNHGVDPLGQFGRVAQTVVPFLVGWLLVAALVGVYRDPWELARSLRTTAGAWLGAATVGLVARNSPALPGDLTWPFPLVVAGTVLVALLVWRGVVVTLWRRRAKGS